MIRYCAVDDHDIVLLGVASMASSEPDLEFCGGAANAQEARQLVAGEKPDVVLLDLRLGSSNSFSLCTELIELVPDLSIVMFTAFGNEELLDEAISAGAVGYVLKDTSTAGLPEVLRTVQKEGAYFDSRVANRALMTKRRGAATHPVLSERERLIVRLIADGEDNWAIAEQLGLSVHMIKFHIGALLKRYGVRRRAELVRVLMERQLL